MGQYSRSAAYQFKVLFKSLLSSLGNNHSNTWNHSLTLHSLCSVIHSLSHQLSSNTTLYFLQLTQWFADGQHFFIFSKCSLMIWQFLTHDTLLPWAAHNEKEWLTQPLGKHLLSSTTKYGSTCLQPTYNITVESCVNRNWRWERESWRRWRMLSHQQTTEGEEVITSRECQCCWRAEGDSELRATVTHCRESGGRWLLGWVSA